MAKNTRQCIAYLDFLCSEANKYFLENKHSYTNDICVYALSASLSAIDNTYSCKAIDYLTDTSFSIFDWNEFVNFNETKFVKSNDENFMCYNFQLSNITTESDFEPDNPYSYEELFNDCVLNNMNNSTAMQYKYIYSAYFNMPNITIDKTTTRELALKNFNSTNNVESTTDFARADYYKFFVPETDIVHDRALLELNDEKLATVGNTSHMPFNCLMYCVNPVYDCKTSASRLTDVPKGFSTDYRHATPISICTFSQDVVLAGNSVVFEPNLNGIVTVE